MDDLAIVYASTLVEFRASWRILQPSFFRTALRSFLWQNREEGCIDKGVKVELCDCSVGHRRASDGVTCSVVLGHCAKAVAHADYL